MKVGVIGYGWVGKAMVELFPDATVYVRDLKKYKNVFTDVDFTDDYSDLDDCDITFIAVPTPVVGEGKLDTSIVEDNITQCNSKIIVVRSTVNPGDCDRWTRQYSKNIVHQPEYLGETPNHPLLKTIETPFIILGGARRHTRKVINLYTEVYNANLNIREVSRLESEVIKMTENRAIAFKVAQCQELYDVCEKANLDYYVIRQAVFGDDPRFNLWFSFVYENKRGFNSKCIPKDIYAWCAWAESLGYEPQITRAILKKNKEWIAMQPEEYDEDTKELNDPALVSG